VTEKIEPEPVAAGLAVAPGVDFINLLWAAFICIDPQSAKKYSQFVSIFLRFWDLHG
jgi:hypothetical protein